MDKESARTLLEAGGFEVAQEKRLANDTGWQLRLTSGQIVSVYDKGTFLVQGKDTEAVRSSLGGDEPAPAAGLAAVSEAPSRKVFVVYGHDKTARTELEAMLRRWGLEPLIMDQLPSEGQTVIEKLERLRKEANFAVVLATPDDEGNKAGREDEKAYRARQNVVLELGMMLAVLGRSRVAILLKNQVNMERPSDIQGLIYIPFKEDVKEAALSLAKEINAQGIMINLSKV